MLTGGYSSLDLLGIMSSRKNADNSFHSVRSTWRQNDKTLIRRSSFEAFAPTGS
jgi:hypothetical protein